MSLYAAAWLCFCLAPLGLGFEVSPLTVLKCSPPHVIAGYHSGFSKNMLRCIGVAKLSLDVNVLISGVCGCVDYVYITF